MTSARTPLFLKTKLITDYRYILGFLIAFGAAYWGPLVAASDFDLLDEEFGILRDIVFFMIPIIVVYGVFIFRQILGGIFQRIPALVPSAEEKYKGTETDSRFESLFKADGYKRFCENVKRWAYSRFEYVLVFIAMIIALGVTYGNWWSLDGLAYSGRVKHPYTDISAATMIATAIILGTLAASAFWFLLTFILAISMLERASSGPDSLNIQTNPMQKESSQALSYHVFHGRSKTIGEFMFQVCFFLLVLGVLLSVMVGVNQLVNLKRPNPLPLIVVVCIDLFILVLFFVPQVGIHRILSRAKSLSLESFEMLFMKLQGKYVSEADKLASTKDEPFQRLEQLETTMATLNMIIEKEKSAPTWTFEFPALMGLIGTAVMPVIGFILQTVLAEI